MFLRRSSCFNGFIGVTGEFTNGVCMPRPGQWEQNLLDKHAHTHIRQRKEIAKRKKIILLLFSLSRRLFFRLPALSDQTKFIDCLAALLHVWHKQWPNPLDPRLCIFINTTHTQISLSQQKLYFDFFVYSADSVRLPLTGHAISDETTA